MSLEMVSLYLGTCPGLLETPEQVGPEHRGLPRSCTSTGLASSQEAAQVEERGPGEGEAVMWSRGLGAVLPSWTLGSFSPHVSAPRDVA